MRGQRLRAVTRHPVSRLLLVFDDILHIRLAETQQRGAARAGGLTVDEMAPIYAATGSLALPAR